MQFDKDLNSEHAELFLEVRGLIKKSIGKEVKEKYSKNITSFFTKEGGFCYIKTYQDYIHIGWFRGISLDDKYNLLFGNGKTIRGQRVRKLDSTTKKAIKYYIEQTLYFLIEYNELMKIKRIKNDKGT
ncbi:hypothetical protein [Arcobacter sp. LA11]|uniref:hypothetical protein n=1 Tax=Arcobacter sp. LA11 TaxID=1898176 RepID=UPI0009356373|nr:hypothetical protein [Arcobacter sp. LA11]